MAGNGFVPDTADYDVALEPAIRRSGGLAGFVLQVNVVTFLAVEDAQCPVAALLCKALRGRKHGGGQGIENTLKMLCGYLDPLLHPILRRPNFDSIDTALTHPHGDGSGLVFTLEVKSVAGWLQVEFFCGSSDFNCAFAVRHQPSEGGGLAVGADGIGLAVDIQ